MEITDGFSLTTNWISRIHCLTLELIGHVGILHQLALFQSFPDLTIEEYKLEKNWQKKRLSHFIHFFVEEQHICLLLLKFDLQRFLVSNE